MKKTLIALSAAIGLLGSCTHSTEIKEESVEIKQFGPGKIDESKAISAAAMLKQFDPSKGEQDFTIEGEITEVCSKAGCWVNIDKGNGETFMVRFKDHFTIPTTTAVGTKAFLHGTAYMDTTSVEDLRHYAEDAGDSKEEIAKITEPTFEMNFEADAIRFTKVTTKTSKK